MDPIFKDLKVVEFASVLAGPAVGSFFSELGARVTKIENAATGGDITRRWRQNGESAEGTSAYYASVNWGKDVRMLDLKDTSRRQEVEALIKEADVVLSNFKKGDDKKLGLDYETLKKLQPNILCGHISGFGSDQDRVAYDLILQAESGFMSMNGSPRGEPTKMPLALIDLLAAHQLKEGLLCAMLEQVKIPGPKMVEVSLYDSAISSLINQATNWLMNQNIPQRIGSLHPNIAPYGEIFYTQDDIMITLAIGSDQQFAKLCAILNCSSEVGEIYQTNQNRIEGRDKLAHLLQKKIALYTADNILAKLHEQYVPAARIKNLKEVFDDIDHSKACLFEEQEGRATIRPKTAIFKVK